MPNFKLINFNLPSLSIKQKAMVLTFLAIVLLIFALTMLFTYTVETIAFVVVGCMIVCACGFVYYTYMAILTTISK